MVIYFVETETSEEKFFSNELKDHTIYFATSIDEVGEDAEVISIFIYSQINEEFLDAHPRLRFIATRSTGVDHINLAACHARQITVSYVPSYGDNTVAEHTFALILAISRRLLESMEASQSERFSYETIRGFDLNGKTIGMIGSGRIGLHAIRIAKAFGMEVVAYDLHPQPFMSEIIGFRYVSLDSLLAVSDIISLHLPLIPDTYHILNRETFAKCKRGAIVINTARGGLIQSEALLEALESGQIGGAGLDVLEDERVLQKETMHIIGDQIVSRLHSGAGPSELRASDPERIQEIKHLMRNAELINRPNVVFTPHVAFNSIQAVERINRTTLESIEAFIAGTPINLVPENQ